MSCFLGQRLRPTYTVPTYIPRQGAHHSNASMKCRCEPSRQQDSGTTPRQDWGEKRNKNKALREGSPSAGDNSRSQVTIIRTNYSNYSTATTYPALLLLLPSPHIDRTYNQTSYILILSLYNTEICCQRQSRTARLGQGHMLPALDYVC